jgi:uracil-DNA glycosylase family 4
MNGERAARKQQLMHELRETIGDCTRCKLHATRSTIVFGEGNPDAGVMFIGEGPGREEDAQGRPFVGRAGQLLTAIIEKGMKTPRGDVYIANVVKCRPTENLEFIKDRPPDEEERKACGPFLLRQIEIIQPKVVVTLGNPSTQFLLGTKLGITKVRGNWFFHNGIPVMPTYHPSYVLRNGDEQSPLKKDVWEDIKKVVAVLNGEMVPQAAVGTGKGVFASMEGLKDEEEEKDVQGRLF